MKQKPTVSKERQELRKISMEYEKQSTLETLCLDIGKKVRKTSDKPFKSTFKINTIKDIETINIEGRVIPAYTFHEDESKVRVGMCYVEPFKHE